MAYTLPVFKKYIDKTRYGLSRTDWGVDFMVMRYTDILMMMAECTLHGGGGTQADVDAIMNQVRTRAGIPANALNTTLDQLFDERAGKEDYAKVYPHKIDLNVLPHIDVFLDNGYTKEEMKMILETKKIMMDDNIAVTATTVRIPTIGGHSEAVNIEFENEFDLAEVRAMLEAEEGVIVQDDPKNFVYPMPITAHGKDEVFVGRIRRDETQPKTLNLWIVADNLRKGAATNAVQIAEYLAKNNLI